MGSCCGNSKTTPETSNLDVESKPIALVQKRWDLFALPHKGYKKMWADVLIAVGSCDFSSDAECSSLQKFLTEACECYKIHNYTENGIFEGLIDKEPEFSREWTQDHDSHINELNGLTAFMDEIMKEPPGKRQLKGNLLYDKLSLFISKDLLHMNWEQDVGIKTLWKYYTDEELLKIVQESLKRYDTPESWKFITPYIVQAGGLEENIEYIMIIKGMELPKEEKESVLKLAISLLPPKRVEKLQNMKIL